MSRFSPNRIAVYLVAVAALATALLPLVTDLGLEQVAAIIAAVGAFAGIVAKWLAGWQQYERAIYQRQITEEALAKEQSLVAQATAPQGRRVNLPR